MVKAFDSDAAGSVLQFAQLFLNRTGTAQERAAWGAANIKGHGSSLQSQVWFGPAITKMHLLDVLATGRNRTQVRKQLDQVFLTLEMQHLIEPYAQDDNPATTYRVLTPLGAELLREDSYIEYIFGLPKVVERWRQSVAKIYHPTESGIGTGYLVRADLVATARHVVDGLKEFVVAFEDGTKVPHAGVLIPKSSEELDIAIVQLAVPVQGRRPFRLTSERHLLEEVVVFGFPPVPQADAAYLVVNRGEISADITLYRSDLQVLVISSLLRGGNSGGPVVNRRGHVIGTVSENLFHQLADTEKSINEGLGFAAAVPSEWVQDLIDGKA